MKSKFLSLLVLAASFSIANAQKMPENSGDLIMDCAKSSSIDASKQLAIWFPYNFWEMIGKQMKVSPEFTKNLVAQMKGYTMFCVVDYTPGVSGMIFKGDDEIRKTIKLTDSAGNSISPIEDNQLSAESKKVVETLRPIMAQTLGQFGEGMQIYLFKAKQVNGEPSISLMTKNNFTLSWNKTILKWRTPFSSVMPPKFCPVDHEKMSGNWNYCPEHGVKLD